MANFNTAIELILKHEGGYVNDPSDRGGETKYGISKKSYPELDIASLTKEHAKEIYSQDYWIPIKGDLINDQSIANHVLDLKVNSGRAGVKVVQDTLFSMGKNIGVDGLIGGQTILALNSVNPIEFNNKLVEKRIDFYKNIVANDPLQYKFLNGWIKRASSFLIEDTEKNYFLVGGILAYLLIKHFNKK